MNTSCKLRFTFRSGKHPQKIRWARPDMMPVGGMFRWSTELYHDLVAVEWKPSIFLLLRWFAVLNLSRITRHSNPSKAAHWHHTLYDHIQTPAPIVSLYWISTHLQRLDASHCGVMHQDAIKFPKNLVTSAQQDHCIPATLLSSSVATVVLPSWADKTRLPQIKTHRLFLSLKSLWNRFSRRSLETNLTTFPE